MSLIPWIQGVSRNRLEGCSIEDSLAQRLAQDYSLPAREAECLACALRGEPSSSIAKRLGISPSTVRTYLVRSYGHVGVSSLEGAKSLFLPELMVEPGKLPEDARSWSSVFIRMVRRLSEAPFQRVVCSIVSIAVVVAIFCRTSFTAQLTLVMGIWGFFVAALVLARMLRPPASSRSSTCSGTVSTVLVGLVFAWVFLDMNSGYPLMGFEFVAVPPLIACLTYSVLVPLFRCELHDMSWVDIVLIAACHMLFFYASVLLDQVYVLFFAALAALLAFGARGAGEYVDAPAPFKPLMLLVGFVAGLLAYHVFQGLSALFLPLLSEVEMSQALVTAAFGIYGVGGMMLVSMSFFLWPIIAAAVSGTRSLDDDLAGHYLRGRGLNELEAATALGLLQGRTLAQLSDELGYSVSSIGAARTSLFRKLSVASRWELEGLVAREVPGIRPDQV